MYDWLRRLFSRAAPSPPPSTDLREQVQAADLALQKRLLEASLSVYDSYVDPREPYIDDADFFYPLINENLPVNIDSRKRGEALPLYRRLNDTAAAWQVPAGDERQIRAAFAAKGIKPTTQQILRVYARNRAAQ